MVQIFFAFLPHFFCIFIQVFILNRFTELILTQLVFIKYGFQSEY